MSVDPRLRGGALLVVALLAVLITAGFNQRITVIAGNAAADPPPGPPSLGECLLQPAVEGISFGWREDGLALIPPLAIGECEGQKYGEVFLVQDSISDQQLKDDLAYLCPGVYLYLGVDVDAPDTQWQALIFSRSTAAGPDPRQAATGQRWVACIVMQAGGVSYEGSLRGSASSGQIPKGFGVCSLGPPTMLGKECDTPHEVESFATKIISEPLPKQSDLDAECEQIVQRATMMPDIFAGGALSVRVEIRQLGVKDGPPSAIATCVVGTTGNRKIIGSLIAQGDSAINFQ